MRRITMWTTAVLLATTAVVLSVRAADAPAPGLPVPVPVPVPAPGAPAPASAATGDDLKAQVTKAYQDAKTYQATVVFAITEKHGRETVTRSGDYTVAFDRATGRVLLDRPEFVIASDGTKLRMKTDQLPGRHLETAAPKTLDLASLNAALDPKQPLLQGEQVPDLAMLLAADPVAGLSGDPAAKVETVKGDGGQAALKFTDAQGNAWTLTVDPATHLVTRATSVVDVTAMGGKPGDSVTLSFDFKVAKHNQPLDAAALAFDAGKRSKAFASLAEMVQGGGEEEAHPLEGKAAPALKLTGMDGKPFDLADVKADVIILDFWATWCAPCRASLPKLQAVYDWAQAEKKSVAIYAVNVREKTEEASDFWTKNKFTMPVLMDSDGAATKAYFARGIPQTVIIHKGVVEFVHVGVPEQGDLADIYKGQINELLGVPAATQPAK